jgi:hypothetical protein
MAGPINFHSLVIKLLADPKFRMAVSKDPAKALRGAKVKATKAQIAALKGVDWKSLAKVEQAFRAGIHPDTGLS